MDAAAAVMIFASVLSGFLIAYLLTPTIRSWVRKKHESRMDTPTVNINEALRKQQRQQ